jgi:ubiquinol-cytochrome c reductase subunit 6
MLYKACEERIKDDTTGDKHCTPQYFRFWACVDKCAAKKVFWSLK